MIFDIDDPDYEKDVVNWIKENIPFLESEYDCISEDITTNVDFSGMEVKVAKINNTQVILLKLPNEDKLRVYYPKEIKQVLSKRIDKYVVDDFFWFYRERVIDIFRNKQTLCSFGMDMTMPFLYV